MVKSGLTGCLIDTQHGTQGFGNTRHKTRGAYWDILCGWADANVLCIMIILGGFL